MRPRELAAFVAEVSSQVVGVAIVRTSIDVGALKSSYALEDFILFSEHQPSQARYTRDTPEIHTRYARDAPEIPPRYARDTPEIRPRIRPRYARDLGDAHIRSIRAAHLNARRMELGRSLPMGHVHRDVPIGRPRPRPTYHMPVDASGEWRIAAVRVVGLRLATPECS